MANVYPLTQPRPDSEDIRVPAPQREGSAIVVHINGDDGNYDPETNTVQVQGDDGDIVVSFGPPDPEPKDSEFGDNLAEHLGDSALTAVSEKLMAGIEADEMSRQAWLENAARGIGLLGLELKAQQGASAGAAQTPAEGTSNVDHPLLLEAVLRFQANARGELLPADGPVKVRNDGEGNQLNLILAGALEKDMNHYLTKTAKEYYPDTDRMLLLLGFSGISFKKGYHCPIKRRPVICSIDAKDLIVSNATTDLDSAGRLTHRVMMRPGTLKRMQMLGAYRDIELPLAPLMPLKNPVDEKIGQVQGIQPVGITYETADLDRELYECYCEIEIPGFEHEMDGERTGLPLPYKVVIDKDSRKILEIRRNWDEDDPLCLPQNRIIAYIFIPGLGFYGIGLLNVLGNATKAVTAAWRLMLDAGMFANFPGFLYLKSFAKQLTNQFRVAPGSGMPIDTVGNDIRASVMPLPYKDPSATFIQLIDNIATVAQRVGGTAELQVGEGKQDAPVGTTLALLEQAVKLMSAVHKRLHQAQSQELELLKTLLMEDPEALWRHNKKSKVLRCLNEQIPELKAVSQEQDQADKRRKQMFLAALAECDLVPAADPNTSSQTERYLKVYALRQIAVTNPNMDLTAVDMRAVSVLGFDDVQSFFKPPPDPNAPPPPPPPEMLTAQATQMAAQARMADSQTRQLESRVKLASAQSDAQLRQQELVMKDQIAKEQVAREMVIHAHDQSHETNRLGMQQRAETQRLAMANQNSEADRRHQLGLAALGHIVDLHREQQAHGVDMQKADHGNIVGIHKAAADREHKFHLQGMAHVHEAHQTGLDHQHQFLMQEHQQRHQAEQAKLQAKNKPKPVAKKTPERALGGRVMAEESYAPPSPPPSGGTSGVAGDGTEVIGSIIASTLRELHKGETGKANAGNAQIAGALRHVAQTMRELRNADTDTSRSTNANTIAAINRLATTLKSMQDTQSQNQQPQTIAAINRLAGTIQELRSADASKQPQTLDAINRLASTLKTITENQRQQPQTISAINQLARTIQELRNSDEAKQPQTLTAINKLASTIHALRDSDASQASAIVRASEERTLGAITHLSSAVRQLRDSDTAHVQANEERTSAAISQLSSAVRELRDNQNQRGDTETAQLMNKFEETLQGIRSELGQSRGGNTDNSLTLRSLDSLVEVMRQPREVGDNGAAALTEQIRRFIAVQTAPRTVVRDQSGRVVGVRVDLPAEPTTEITSNTDGTVNVELDE